ncbi:polymorphic toxin-type HINT domain-containing protein, partial [Streptomyces sp. NPDC048340]
QVDRLIAEASGIAAKANENRWRAAEAAAKAAAAKAEADIAAAEAQKSKEAAAKSAADANNSANAAQASATAAKNSAASARNAAAAADRDADAAEESAAQAAFSAQYARDSAAQADASAADARQSAIAAGKSRDEADALAGEAWTEVKKKFEAEEATRRRLAEEARKKQAEEEKKKKPKCIVPYNRDSLPPCMMGADPDQVVFGKPDPDLAKLLLKGAWELSGGADIQRCIEEPSWGGCAMAIAGVTPWGKALKVVKWGAQGVEAAVDARKLQRVLTCPIPGAKHSFPAGTRVLMGDGSARPIEQIAVGDSVLATDPESGTTGSRRVDATIYTPDDRDFTGITLDAAVGGGSVTTTDHHPFWSENAKAWINAGDLNAGDTLRTADGNTARIDEVRHWKTLQPAYNLTVNDLHTYYVLAGTAPVLVHNEDGFCGFSLDTVGTAYENMNKGGGHAIRYLVRDGLIPNAGSLPQRVEQFKKLTSHILTNPTKTFDWKTGNTPARAFAGMVDGKHVVLMVAKEGPHAGKVLTSYIPDADQIIEWGL